MVNNSEHLNFVFSALSDPTRREMLARLSTGVMTVKELAEPFEMSSPAITKHLRVLEKAGLLRREKQGRVHHCYLIPGPLKEASEWVAYYQKFWQKQFDSLEKYLSGLDKHRI